MAELSTTDDQSVEEHDKAIHKGPSLHQLMDAIRERDLVKCKRMLADKKIRKRLNYRVRLKAEGYMGYMVPPLVWAVMNRNCEIVELLLGFNIKVDIQGSYEVDEKIYSLSPLLKAIENNDSQIIRMLLEHGAQTQTAIPGPQMIEEEGGIIQYNKWLFPLNFSIGGDLSTFRTILEYSDVSVEYGPHYHTCLCYAIDHFISAKTNDQSYIQEIISRGGQICSGSSSGGWSSSGSAQRTESACGYLQELARLTVPVSNNGQYRYIDKDCLSCVQSVCQTDYVYEGSPICRVLHHYARCLGAKGVYIVFCSEQEKAALTWMFAYPRTLSTLQHICRVTIRKCVRPMSREKCEQLPLPSKLIRYVTFNEE